MIFKDLTYKKKSLYLLIGSVVFLYIVYTAALGKTVNLYRENKSLEEKIGVAEGAETSVSKLQSRLSSLDNYLNQYILDTLNDEQIVLQTVSDLCKSHSVVLKKFPKAEITQQNDFNIETNIIEAEGSYINLLYLIYDLEQKSKVGRVSSVGFKTYTDSKSKRLILSLTIYLQSIRINPK